MALGLVFLGSLAQAATSYDCGSLSLTVGKNKVRVTGLDGARGPVTGSKTRYNPSAEHAGSTRYDISSVCQSSGDVYAILDKDLSTGKDRGELTIQSTCDADGGAPSFDRYSCRVK